MLQLLLPCLLHVPLPLLPPGRQACCSIVSILSRTAGDSVARYGCHCPRSVSSACAFAEPAKPQHRRRAAGAARVGGHTLQHSSWNIIPFEVESVNQCTLCRLRICRMSAASASLCSVCHDSTASTMLLKLAAAACAGAKGERIVRHQHAHSDTATAELCTSKRASEQASKQVQRFPLVPRLDEPKRWQGMLRTWGLWRTMQQRV